MANISNQQFMTELFSGIRSDEACWTCVFSEPSDSQGSIKWKGQKTYIDSVDDSPHGNAYFSLASLNQKAQGRTLKEFSRLFVLVVDDATDVELEPTYSLQTSAGSRQVGYKLSEPIADFEMATTLVKALATAGHVDADTSGNNAIRYCRLPIGYNNKLKYGSEPFACKLEQWNPERTFTIDQLVEGLGLKLAPVKQAPKQPIAGEIFEGGRNAALASMAGNVRRVGASESEIKALLHTANEERCSPPLPHVEVEKIACSVARYEPHRDVMSNAALGMTAAQSVIDSDGVVDTDRLNYLLPKYQYDTDIIKPVEYVIDGFFSNKLTLIAGAPGVGKSTALVSMAAVAAGILMTEGVTAELKRKVFYITEDAEQIERILFGLRHQGLTTWTQDQIAESFVIINARRRPHAEIASMVFAARETGINEHESGYQVQPLIILDTSNATLDLDNENDNSEASKAIAAIKQAIGDAALWLVGHTAKAINRADLQSLSFRGASAFEGDANATSYLFADEKQGKDVRFLALGKHRFVADYKEIRIDTYTGHMESATAWGSTQKTFYCVGTPSRTSIEARKEVTQAARDEELAQKKREMKEAIAYTVATENRYNQPINRERLKKMISGNSQAIIESINELIADEWLKEVRSEGKKGFDLISLKVPNEQAVQPDVEGSIAALLSKAKDAEVGTIRNDLASLVG
jgi:energy-coupling factor transporter ATP-binding protein EcfA2